jgi:signal transduction histidine kinase
VGASGRAIAAAAGVGAVGVAAALAGPAAGAAIAAVGALAVGVLLWRGGPAPRAEDFPARAVLAMLPEGVAVFGADGRVRGANAAFAHAIGVDDPVALHGRALEQLTGEARPPWFGEALAAPGPLPRDVALLGPTGAPLTLEAIVGRVGAGDVALALRHIDDVDLERELAQTPTHIKDPVTFFQSLFDAMEDAITVLSPEGEILQANRAARAMFGRDLAGRKCYRAFRMRELPCPECPAEATRRSGETQMVEHRLFGNAITRIRTYPLLGRDGEVRAIINHKRDVTQERQLEELKAGFIALVSHELRTPLTSIIGFNKLNLRRLARRVKPALEGATTKVRETLDTVLADMEVMQSEGDRLGRLVNDVLDLSKLEAGRLTLRLGAVPVAPLVEGAVASTASLWRAKGLRVRIEMPDPCPSVWGDPDRVSQVLVNLLSNAIKFTDEGGIAVHVVPAPREVCFAVRDSGPGISPDQIPFLFEKFRQVGDTVPGRVPGTGLGLAISRELVTLHSGRIWAESEPGRGSTFRFTVPRADVLTAPGGP